MKRLRMRIKRCETTLTHSSKRASRHRKWLHRQSGGVSLCVCSGFYTENVSAVHQQFVGNKLLVQHIVTNNMHKCVCIKATFIYSISKKYIFLMSTPFKFGGFKISGSQKPKSLVIQPASQLSANANAIDNHDASIDFATAFDNKRIMRSGGSSASSRKELVIPLIAVNKYKLADSSNGVCVMTRWR